MKLAASDNDDMSVGSSSSKRSGSLSEMAKAVGVIKEATKQMGKAMTQVTEVFEHLRNDNSIGAQSHAQVGRIVSGGSGVYAFVSQSTSLEEYVCLDSCLSEHVFYDSCLVFNIRKGDRQLNLDSNGGSLTIQDIANFEGFEESVWLSEEAITNTLSLIKVRLEYPVSSSYFLLSTDTLT